jgi:RNAse (barnase) inhibitor barstar
MKDEHKQLIEKTRAKVQKLMAEQDKLYSEMMRELGITDDPTASGDFLWDYVFNCTDNTEDSYLTMVRDNIFGKEKSFN